MDCKFHGCLPSIYRRELEELFFFNKEQSIFYPKIEIALEKYGNPRINENDNKIKISLERLINCQNLILMRPSETPRRILGIILHSRISNEVAEIIHFAINKNTENKSDEVLVKMITEVSGIYKRIKGIKSIHIIYTGTKIKI